MFYNADFDFKITCMLSAVDKLEPNETGILRMPQGFPPVCL